MHKFIYNFSTISILLCLADVMGLYMISPTCIARACLGGRKQAEWEGGGVCMCVVEGEGGGVGWRETEKDPDLKIKQTKS